VVESAGRNEIPVEGRGEIPRKGYNIEKKDCFVTTSVLFGLKKRDHLY